MFETERARLELVIRYVSIAWMLSRLWQARGGGEGGHGQLVFARARGLASVMRLAVPR